VVRFASVEPLWAVCVRFLIARLDKVRAVSHNFGYGVGDDMDSLLAKYVGE
jgi:hypothetical protein